MDEFDYLEEESERGEPSSEAHFYYKLVARCGSKFLSIYDGVTEYQIGQVLKQRISRGGYYVYRTLEEAMNARLPSSSALFIAPRCVLKCLAWGDSKTYGSKLCFEYLRPTQVLLCPIGYKCTNFAPTRIYNVKLNAARARMPRFSTSRQSSFKSCPYKRQDELHTTLRELTRSIYDHRPKSSSGDSYSVTGRFRNDRRIGINSQAQRRHRAYQSHIPPHGNLNNGVYGTSVPKSRSPQGQGPIGDNFTPRGLPSNSISNSMPATANSSSVSASTRFGSPGMRQVQYNSFFS